MQDLDVILVGSGIMSATLGVMLKRLAPSLRIHLHEAAPLLCPESSHGWHNAGTGHAGLCEMSYTPDRGPDGTVNVNKALEIFAQFERSKQFWSYASRMGVTDRIRDCLRPVPHLSFVRGEEQVEFLRSRHRGLTRHPFFSSMVFTSDRSVIARWAPLLVEGRDVREPVAATRMNHGTDVDFGALARQFLQWFSRQTGCGLATNSRVTLLEKQGDHWVVESHNVATGERRRMRARFVFIGAGGGSLLLLQRAGIAETKGYGGFPVGGQWLVCDNPAVVSRHAAKVYGQALGAAPTMAVPHLDTRMLDGRHTLLFGPYAAWTTKFLQQHGSRWDLLRSLQTDNVGSMAKAGLQNLPLVRYLVQQGTQSMAERLAALRDYYPAARQEDWRLVQGGIRVQLVKKTNGEAGIVHYGTEIAKTADRSMAALLGASPGASVSVDIMLDIVKQCFPDLLASPAVRTHLDMMIPTWNHDIADAEAADCYCRTTMKSVDHDLGIVQNPDVDLLHPVTLPPA